MPTPKKIIELNYGTIRIELFEDKTGTITSKLKEDKESLDAERYNTGIDAIESMILAHACAGVNVESPEYAEGIITAIDALANQLM